MKLLCEVPLNEVNSHERSQFSWLSKSNGDNFLFTSENEKRLRVFTVKQNTQNSTASAHEAQSASLAEPRRCTCLSWNRDESLLALVVDRRQIYFWEVRRNTFVQFRPKYLIQQQQQQQHNQQQQQFFQQQPTAATRAGQRLVLADDTQAAATSSSSASVALGGRRKSSSKDIELIAWSKLSDKLAICFADGQILLCNVAAPNPASHNSSNNEQQQQQQAAVYHSLWEHFISNSDGVLKRIDAIYVSDHADLFACTSISAELLVMTFDGDNRLYCQSEGEGSRLYNLKFSPLVREYNPRLGIYSKQSLWLAYRTDCENSLFFRKLHVNHSSSSLPVAHLANEDAVSHSKLGILLQDVSGLESSNADDMEHEASNQMQCALIDFYWLNSTRLIGCLSSGSIQLIQINSSTTTAGGNNNNESGANKSNTNAALPTNTKLGLIRNGTPNYTTTRLDSSEVLRIQSSAYGGTTSPIDDDVLMPMGQTNLNGLYFKTFELERRISQSTPASKRQLETTNWRQSFVLAAGTSNRLYYYEIYESRELQAEEQFYFEQFDEVDLSEALARVQLNLEHIKWSQDCSMLAVQLTSGHLLIYQTQLLHSHMVASYASKTAYLSAPTEITLLNYGSDELLSRNTPLQGENQTTGNLPGDSASGGRQSSCSSRCQQLTSGNAIILPIQFKPSLLAIGPKHLAVALNNRVRFYAIETIQRAQVAAAGANQQTSATSKREREFDEQEYVTLVVGIGLSSKFVAILLDDGRVKLHSLKQLMLEHRLIDEGGAENGEDGLRSPGGGSELISGDEDDEDEGPQNDERFFPDPTQSRSQKITAFSLTEHLLVYSTRDFQIHVFNLNTWLTMQICTHSKLFASPIWALKANERGNKFACLLNNNHNQSSASSDRKAGYGSTNDDDDEQEARVFLYDLFTNNVYRLSSNSSTMLIDRILDEQLTQTLSKLPIDSQKQVQANETRGRKRRRHPNGGAINDVIWDTDGRTILFVESQFMHVFALLEHTLEQETPLALYADSARKASSYSTLYVSQGIASYQTSLGRVVNVILETHDDELKLTRLEQQIAMIKEQQGAETTHHEGQLEGQLKVMLLKLDYLRTILPIYSLPKCNDICEHLMEDEAFLLKPSQESESGAEPEKWNVIIDQLIWRQLASWAIFVLNLQFARQIYSKHQMFDEADQLDALFEEMRARGLDSRIEITNRITSLLKAKVEQKVTN